MKTSQSPLAVLKAAYELASPLLDAYSARRSRHDFTQPGLFACLVLQQFYGLSYRRAEQLLRDSQEWLGQIGLDKAPDHNTLWRAMDRIMQTRRVSRMLDELVKIFARRQRLGLSHTPLALDSTCFEQHHRSGHYDRRCRQMQIKALQKQAKAQQRQGKKQGKAPEKPGSWGRSVNARRRRKVAAMPKLSVAVAGACHLVVAAKVRTGNGSDAPDFKPLLSGACRRAAVKTAVSDSGYDSEDNHRIAREELGVRSIIPPGIGRPSKKPPSGRWRRHMARRFARKADKKPYGQRAQSETVHSMIKRNQGSALRSRTPARRKKEMLLRMLTHNIALLCELENEG
jgi:hypothetical protein